VILAVTFENASLLVSYEFVFVRVISKNNNKQADTSNANQRTVPVPCNAKGAVEKYSIIRNNGRVFRFNRARTIVGARECEKIRSPRKYFAWIINETANLFERGIIVIARSYELRVYLSSVPHVNTFPRHRVTDVVKGVCSGTWPKQEQQVLRQRV